MVEPNPPMTSWVALPKNERDEELEKKFTNLTDIQMLAFHDFRIKCQSDRPIVHVHDGSTKFKVLTWKDSFLIRKLNKYIQSNPAGDGDTSDVGTSVLVANKLDVHD